LSEVYKEIDHSTHQRLPTYVLLIGVCTTEKQGGIY